MSEKRVPLADWLHQEAISSLCRSSEMETDELETTAKMLDRAADFMRQLVTALDTADIALNAQIHVEQNPDSYRIGKKASDAINEWRCLKHDLTQIAYADAMLTHRAKESGDE